jgi:hypothetical protein
MEGLLDTTSKAKIGLTVLSNNTPALSAVETKKKSTVLSTARLKFILTPLE